MHSIYTRSDLLPALAPGHVFLREETGNGRLAWSVRHYQCIYSFPSGPHFWRRVSSVELCQGSRTSGCRCLPLCGLHLHRVAGGSEANDAAEDFQRPVCHHRICDQLSSRIDSLVLYLLLHPLRKAPHLAIERNILTAFKFLGALQHSLLHSALESMTTLAYSAPAGLVASIIVKRTQKFKLLISIGWALLAAGVGSNVRNVCPARNVVS